MELIVDWWDRAWLSHPGTAERFRIEARASLPLAEDADGSSAPIFAGLQARRFSLRAAQQVPKWRP
ncbi:hypothetical protein ACVDG3_21720 [Meridianimarinicoccus sp. RP-17]|uniref:hypothetical protein n=1 Tax=Meridianimarinicoccus zhengii TaxID=2056810 RepID=UPI0013A6FF9B|nr:hypothetical protein [Phycocomes zhengii]